MVSLSEASRKSLEEKFLKGIPFSYLLNQSEFFGHKFFVNENVLIPRPETEHLVDMIVRSGKKFKTLLDMGTGSGVLLLSLLKAGVAQEGTGADISLEALEVAAINAARLRLMDRAEFLPSDRFTKITGSFDLIVSNPPYIKETLHRNLVQSTVDAFEPHLALYLPDEEYEAWFLAFFSGVRKHLTPGGEFWMEGHEKELKVQAETLRELGFHQVRVIQDFAGLDRFLSASLP